MDQSARVYFYFNSAQKHEVNEYTNSKDN